MSNQINPGDKSSIKSRFRFATGPEIFMTMHIITIVLLAAGSILLPWFIHDMVTSNLVQIIQAFRHFINLPAGVLIVMILLPTVIVLVWLPVLYKMAGKYGQPMLIKWYGDLATSKEEKE